MAQMPRIAKFLYAGHDVQVRVRDCYVNVTQFCRIERKRARDIMRGKDYTAYLETVASKTQICASSLTEKRHGGTRGGETWAHPLVASWVAERMSSEAAFFIHSTLRDLHLTGAIVERAERDLETRAQQLESHTKKLSEALFQSETKVSQLAHKLARRAPTGADRAAVERCWTLFYKKSCPICATTDGPFHLDHFDGPQNASLSGIWKICEKCNLSRRGHQTAERRNLVHRAFDKFQERLWELTGGQGNLELRP